MACKQGEKAYTEISRPTLHDTAIIVTTMALPLITKSYQNVFVGQHKERGHSTACKHIPQKPEKVTMSLS